MNRKVSKEDVLLIGIVADCAEELGLIDREKRGRLILLLVEVQTYTEGLRLQEMIDAARGERPSDFSHDIAGIWNHWDPVGNVFRDCFSPRFANAEEGG